MKILIMGVLLVTSLFANTFRFQIIESANEAYKNGEYFRSAKLFAELDRDDPIVAYDLANAQYRAKMYDDALENYEKSKGVDEATRQYNMGNCYFQKGKLKDAIRRYRLSLKMREDEDTRYNLELARAKQKEKKQSQDKKDKKKKEKKEKKEKKPEEKKRDEKRREDKPKREEEKKKQQPSNRNGEEKENRNKKKSNKEEAQKAQKREEAEDMRPEEKLRKKELSHLLKKLSKRKMPTMMYRSDIKEGERHDKNPW